MSTAVLPTGSRWAARCAQAPMTQRETNMEHNTAGNLYGNPIIITRNERERRRGILLGAVQDWQYSQRCKEEDPQRSAYHVGRYQGARDALLTLGMSMRVINDALDSGIAPDIDTYVAGGR